MQSRWAHAPYHFFKDKGSYMVTGATYQKEHLFKTDDELHLLQNKIFCFAEQYQWKLQAWAIFTNHYHLIAYSLENPESLGKFIKHLHASTAKELNLKHSSPGRKVWFQYWDTKLSFETSYYARLNYVMQNPVKHKLVQNACDYKWCSAGWFKETTTKAQFKTITNYKIDTVNVTDDF